MKYGVTEVFVKHEYFSELRIKILKKSDEGLMICEDKGDCLCPLFVYVTDRKLYPLKENFLSYELENIEEYVYIYEDGEHSQYRYKYIKHIGSSRSSKSFSLEEAAIRRSESIENYRTTVWRDSRESLGNSVWKDFRKIFPLSGRKYKFPRNTVPIFFENNSVIEPHGDDTTNAHGITQDLAWLNEPYKMTKETFDQIDQRANQVWIDINPSGIHWSDNLDNHPRCKVIHSTFMLNPFCPIEQKKKILSYDPSNPINIKNETANEYMWQVYGLGLKAEKPNRIFRGWKIIDDELFDNLPYQKYYGLDFGMSAPTALVAMKTDADGTYFLKELLYKPMNSMEGTLSEELEKLGIETHIELICDSGNELNQSEGRKLKNSGFNIIFAEKGQGSVVSAIETMQKSKIMYTKSSKNLENNYENYSWKVHQGIQLDIPEETREDLIDASKYVIKWFSKTRYLT